jgi:competence protein ComEA
MTLRTAGEEAEEDYPEIESDDSSEEGRNTGITIYVCGAVVREGVYTLPADARAADALQAAGGYSEDAAKGIINLAAPLTDGEMLRFPTEEEAENMSPAERESRNPAPGDAADSSGEMNGKLNGKLNINKATKEELESLPGIGERKAEDIISYRESCGGFQNIEELKNISGIKDGVFDKLKDLITVDGK